MSTKQVYRQCALELPLENGGRLVDHAWIPAKLAKVGKRLVIDTKAEGFRDGWIVVTVGGSKNVDDLETQRKAQKRWEDVLDHGVRK